MPRVTASPRHPRGPGGGTLELCTLLQQWLAGQRLKPPARSPLPAALGHRLAGMLYHIGAPLSESDARQCRRAWADNVGAHLLRMEAFSRSWPREAPPPLVFKGADLVEHLYDDPGARPARDLDLLVPPEAFPRLVRHLARTADRLERPRHERFVGDAEHAVGLRFGPLLIEVHAHPWPPHRGGPEGWVFWARGRPGRLGDVEVLFPSPADRALLWLGNLAKGGFQSDLADLLDFAVISSTLHGDVRIDAEADAVGLGLAMRLARLRLQQSGLWPHGRAPARVRLLNAWLPPVGAPRAEVPLLRGQLLKAVLAAPGRRTATLARVCATGLRHVIE